MKKNFKIFLCFWVSCFFTVFADITVKYPPKDISRIIDSGILRVAMVKTDVPPFFFTDSKGNFTGIDVVLAQRIAKALGVKVFFNRTTNSFDELVVKVVNGEADVVISKLSRTSYRAKNALFSKPYARFRQALALNRIVLAKIVPDEDTIPLFIKDFRGRIGVKKGTSYVLNAHKNFPNADIVQFENWEKDIVGAVLKGDVLAVYRDEFEIKKINLLHSEASLELKVVILTDVKDNIAMAVSWQSRQLLDWINLFLENNDVLYSSQDILKEYASELSILNKSK